ncbi:MAG: hypothetical protein K9L85_01420 [Candidatus Peribacteraceae bacterium]|nr:hypothetical protein [Candidatus Peribacteraceae bacterium]
MVNTKSRPEIKAPKIEAPASNSLDERLKLLSEKINFLMERAGTSQRELLELREEVQKALTVESAEAKAEILARGEELLTSPEFEAEVEQLAHDPLLIEKVAASGVVFERLRKHPKTDLAKLDAQKIIKDPELLTAIEKDPKIWEQIKTNAVDAVAVIAALRDPKSWSEKIGSTGDSIVKFAKRNPEFTAAATIGLTIGGILLMLGEGKVKKALGAISLGIAGFLGFQKWGEEIGWLVEAGLKKLGVSQKTIDEWKNKKEKTEQDVKRKFDAAKNKIKRGKEFAENWKTEVAGYIGDQINDAKLEAILAKWSAGQKLSEEDKMSVNERLLRNGFIFVVIDGGGYLVKGATFFPYKWAEGVSNSVHGLFSRNIERGVIEYLKGGIPFAVLGGSMESAKAFFTTTTHKSVWKSFLKGAAKGGVNYSYRVPVMVIRGGRAAGKFIYDISTKGFMRFTAEALARSASRAERPLAKATLRKMEQQLLKLCGKGATKKFIQAALKKTGMKRIGSFLAKRAAAAGGSALTGVGTVVSIGILAWTLWDVGVMSYEGYQLYDLHEKMTARGKMPIKNIYLDTATQRKLKKLIPKDVADLQVLDEFRKLPTATLYIEREGKNDREKWVFENGEIVDIQIEKI